MITKELKNPPISTPETLSLVKSGEILGSCGSPNPVSDGNGGRKSKSQVGWHSTKKNYAFLMKAWIRWLKGDGYLTSKNPITVFGRFVLSLWIAIIVSCALIIAGIFISNPGEFIEPEKDQTCRTVEYDGGVVDTCEYLTP
jgi:hypothetical protein